MVYGESEVVMFVNSMMCLTGSAVLSPFEHGGNFERAKIDPRALLAELRAEQEEVRIRRRQIQEMISMSSKQIEDCSSESSDDRKKSVIGWLTGAAVVFIFGLLFSAGAMATCGACGSFGVSGMLILIGIILSLRALGEYNDLKKLNKSKSMRMERYSKEFDQYNEKLYNLNLREAELEESIRSAQKYL